MHKIALVFACLLFVTHGRRLHLSRGPSRSRGLAGSWKSSEGIDDAAEPRPLAGANQSRRDQSSHPQKILAMLLQQDNPAAAFNLPSPGASFVVGKPNPTTSPLLASGVLSPLDSDLVMCLTDDLTQRPALHSKPKCVKLRRNTLAAARTLHRTALVGSCAAIDVLLRPQHALAVPLLQAFDLPPLDPRTIGKYALCGGAIYIGVFIVRKVNQLLKVRKEFKDTMAEFDKMFEGVEGDLGMDSTSTATDLSSVSQVAAKPQAEKEPVKAAPVAATKKEEAPKGFASFFKKKEKKDVPSLAELTADDSDKAALCRTLAWALKAPVEVSLASDQGAAQEAGSNSAQALALSVSEELTVLREEAVNRGLSQATMAQAVEQVGNALLNELVDAAAAVLYKPEFDEAASALCLFIQNAMYTVVAMGVEHDVNNVAYEGVLKPRKLEQVYTECLSLSDLGAGDMMALMGMGDESDDSSKLGFAQVEQLGPVLGIQQQKAEKLMQNVAQKQMSKMSDFALKPDKKKKPGDMTEKEMEQSVDMLEMMYDSGMMSDDDIKTLKKSLSDQMGMPIEEFLTRKAELDMSQLSPEQSKLFNFVERLCDPNSKPPKQEALDDYVDQGPPVQEIDPSMQFNVRKGAASGPAVGEEAPIEGDESVEIKVKKKSTSAAPVDKVTPPSTGGSASTHDAVEQTSSASGDESLKVNVRKRSASKPAVGEEAPSESDGSVKINIGKKPASAAPVDNEDRVTPDMESSMEALEQQISAGMSDEELESIKKDLEDKMGLPIEQILAFKDQLRPQLPPKEAKIIDIIDKLVASSKKP